MKKETKTNFLAKCILADLTRASNEGEYKDAVKKMAELLIQHGNKLEDELALMTAGREQDRAELKICVEKLEHIATSLGAWSAKQMMDEAQKTLSEIGAW